MEREQQNAGRARRRGSNTCNATIDRHTLPRVEQSVAARCHLLIFSFLNFLRACVRMCIMCCMCWAEKLRLCAFKCRRSAAKAVKGISFKVTPFILTFALRHLTGVALSGGRVRGTDADAPVTPGGGGYA